MLQVPYNRTQADKTTIYRYDNDKVHTNTVSWFIQPVDYLIIIWANGGSS